jgi:cytochrome d ubiquinol oxidase subunit I
LLAFFLESTFLGVWVFGWEKLSKGVHALAIWLVALGANISALWILIANSFMQQPVGYSLRNGRAEMTDFFALLFNPNLRSQFPHVVAAGLLTAAFFIIGISDYHLMRKNQVEVFRRSFEIAAVVGALAGIVVILNGHAQAQHMVQAQPMKMASAEALWRTESPASFSLLTIGDLSQRKEVFSIRLPRMLCLLAYNRLDCTVEGIYDLQQKYAAQYGPGDYIPPVAFTYWTFRAMVGSGFLLFGLAMLALFLMRKDIAFVSPPILRIFIWAIALPYLANTSGWLLTELGRAPWVVYGLMKIENAASKAVSAGEVLATLVGFTLVYGLLMVADIYLLSKYARAGFQPGAENAELPGEQAPSLLAAQD